MILWNVDVDIISLLWSGGNRRSHLIEQSALVASLRTKPLPVVDILCKQSKHPILANRRPRVSLEMSKEGFRGDPQNGRGCPSNQSCIDSGNTRSNIVVCPIDVVLCKDLTTYQPFFSKVVWQSGVLINETLAKEQHSLRHHSKSSSPTFQTDIYHQAFLKWLDTVKIYRTLGTRIVLQEQLVVTLTKWKTIECYWTI